VGADFHAMSEYLLVTGSALFAVPPGTRAGEHLGQSLFA
jgi:deferrochelatase/peroxidase EfeB